MTEKLFYKNVYLREFDAMIKASELKNGMPAVTLDKTAFYPEGGGQGADHGTMKLADGRIFEVNDVREEDGQIWHYLSEDAEGSLHPGDSVSCIIDWERRFDHMQQHSGEHIVSGMICEMFSCNNVGFHLGEDCVTIDFDARISFEQAVEIEKRANKYIWEDHPVQEMWPDREELASIEFRSKKEIEGDVRLIAFPGADICACCGTHVSGSAQIGMVKFISAKNFHEGTRLELLCGKRAYEFFAKNFEQAKSSAVLLSTSTENLTEHVEKIISENQRLKAAAAEASGRLLNMMAENCKGKGDILVISDEAQNVQPRELADLIAGNCMGTAAVFAMNGGRYNYAIINKQGFPDQMIRDLNGKLNGKGGGRNGFAQGSVQCTDDQIRAFFPDYFCL